jgi:hypothetical protein
MNAAGTIVRGPREPVAPDQQIAPLLETFVGPGPVPGRDAALFHGQRLLCAANKVRGNGLWFQLDWGDCLRRPGELSKWACPTCGIALLEHQVADDPVSGAPLHWVWVPGGQVGHPVTSAA